MLVAIMSDSHDNIWNIRKAISRIREVGAAAVIHCGDFVAPFSLKEVGECGVPVHGVFGNNDGDKFLLMRTAQNTPDPIRLYGLTGEVDFQGFRIGFTHEEVTARGLAASGRYQMVCFGHTHQHMIDRQNGTHFLNPGEVMGKEGDPGFCLVNTESGEITRLSIDR
jgi:putative phosphoesterase